MREPDPAAIETATRLQRSAARLARRLRPPAGAGLSPARLGILGALRRHGPLSAVALAGDLGIRPQSLTRLLHDLESGGLIARREDETDRRRSVIALTATGEERLLREIGQRRSVLADAIAATLTPTEQDLLRLAAGLIDRVVAALPQAPPAEEQAPPEEEDT